MIKNYWNHLKLISKHKYLVMKYCFKSGLYLQGILHDLSKFTPLEFLTSCKYYSNGSKSPNEAEKEKIGYSLVWLNHRGRNRHHEEFWIDFNENGEAVPIKIPEKYVFEMVIDWIAAGKVYMKDKWTQSSPLEYYFNVKNNIILHDETFSLFEHILKFLYHNGLDKTLRVMKCFEYTE